MLVKAVESGDEIYARGEKIYIKNGWLHTETFVHEYIHTLHKMGLLKIKKQKEWSDVLPAMCIAFNEFDRGFSLVEITKYNEIEIFPFESEENSFNFSILFENKHEDMTLSEINLLIKDFTDKHKINRSSS